MNVFTVAILSTISLLSGRALAQATPLCERSGWIQEAAISSIGEKAIWPGYRRLACEEVTAEHLARIERLNIRSEGIPPLGPRDLEGMTGLKSFSLSNGGELPLSIVELAQEIERRAISELSFSQALGEYRDDIVAFTRNELNLGSSYYGPHMVQMTDDEIEDFTLGRSDFQLVCFTFLIMGTSFARPDTSEEEAIELFPEDCRSHLELLNDEYNPSDRESLDSALRAIRDFDPSLAQGLLSSRPPYWNNPLYEMNRRDIAVMLEDWIGLERTPDGEDFFFIHILYFDVGVRLVNGVPRVVYINTHDS